MKKKLVDLLNEFESTKKIYVKWNLGEKGNIFQGNFANTDLKIISKKYEFIKRIVENDKIELEKVKNIKLPLDTKLRAKVDKDEKTCLNRLYTLKLLMLLSISDTPIEDLISYLKIS